MNVLISACLLGQCCRYDGQSKEYAAIKKLIAEPSICLIPVCPEQMGGLATPRPAAEQKGHKVVTACGSDVTAAYERGAQQALRLAGILKCSLAVLKEKSPSCGSGRIYDGTFTRTLTKGDGITAALLKGKGIVVIGETDEAGLEELLKKVRS